MLKKGSVEISEITDELFISSEPGTVHMEAILERNIGLIISMIGNHRPPQSFGPQTWHIRRRIERFEELWRQREEQSAPPREAYSEFVTNAVSKMVWGLRFGRER
jgi:hypothetical protein